MKVNLQELETRVKQRTIKKSKCGEYTIWCYTQHCVYDNLWDDYSRFARGIVTLPDGTIIARPFPKFYNLGDPAAGKIPWHEPIEATEKLDGTLIVLSHHNGKTIITTKSSFNNEYTIFAGDWLMINAPDLLHNKGNPKNMTYCFEAIFPETYPGNRKITNYGDKTDLTLLAEINTHTGAESPYDHLLSISEEHGIPITPKHEYDDIDQFVDKIKSRPMDEGEGVVLRFIESNKRVKLKSDEYLRIARTITHMGEKHILDSLSHEDDIESIYSALPDEFYNEVHNTIDKLKNEYNRIHTIATGAIPEIQEFPSRKSQAKYIHNDPRLYEIQGILFAMLDGVFTPSMVWDLIKKNRKSKKK